MRVFSFAFNFMLFSSLAFLVVGFAENEFAFLPIIFGLGGIIVQAFFLRRFRLSQRGQTKICRHCSRAISVEAKICRFCLTAVEESPVSSAQATSLKETEDLQLQTERWQAANNADMSA